MATNLIDANREWTRRPADERYETLAALHAAVSARRGVSRTFQGTAQRLQLVSRDADIVIRAGEAEMRPTHYAFGQLAALAGAPANYLRNLPAELATANLAHGLSRAGAGDKDGKVRLLAAFTPGADMPALRAVTSSSYGRIWDADITAALLRIVERHPEFHNPRDWSGTPSGLYASDRDVFAFLVDGGSVVEEPEGFGHRPSQLHRGFFVRNSETGAGLFEFCCFLFRVVCGNHIIWDAENVTRFRIRHNRLAPQHFEHDAFPAIRRYVTAAESGTVEMIRKAQAYMLPAPKPERIDWLRGKDFTQAEAADAIELAEREEGDGRTLWQVVQGLTARARQMVHVDARVELERRAGRLLKLAA